ncbi:hypothetical protein WDW86_07155 [Bdellovibrionota bacterium FG-2]
MNLAKIFGISILSLLYPLALFAAPASLKEAQDQMSKAYQQYYEAISGKELSKEKKQELVDKIITPANRELDNFVKNHIKESIEKAVLGAMKKTSKPGAKKGYLEHGDATAATAGSTAPKVQVVPPAKVEPVAPKEAVVIEGDGPQEIDFPGPRPVASPTPQKN